LDFSQEGRKLAKLHKRNMVIPSYCSGQTLQAEKERERTFSSSFPVPELLQNSFPKSLSSVDPPLLGRRRNNHNNKIYLLQSSSIRATSFQLEREALGGEGKW
jgi:hypothetical protein